MREIVECWGDYHLKHKRKEFIINTPSITFWGVVSPRLARCHLGASVKIVEVNQGVCRGKEIGFFMKIYPSEASPSCVEPSVDSHNRYPSWVEVSINMDV